MTTSLSIPALDYSVIDPARGSPAAPADCDIAAVAALLADSTRAAMLLSLLDGRIRPASELARLGHVTAATASEHLSKLVAGGLVAVEPRGRFRFYRLANVGLAEALETLATIAPRRKAGGFREQQRAAAIQQARLCYDHLAGSLGVMITDALVAERAIAREDRAFLLSDKAHAAFGDLGIDVDGLRRGRRLLGRACLDWSERRYHLGGPLGVALASRLLELEWIERSPETRALRVTNDGRRALKARFGVRLY
jgi:DNA-binding transcriptional ArsR family regulator